jgi:FKBP-type peptidyl-prolyl cis-trans isomerase
MRKRLVALAIVAGLIFSGCSDDNGCKPLKPEAEEAQITAYATANGLVATKHSSGMYYQIMNPGSGPTPTMTSKVYVTYTGKRLDNTIFDQSTSPVAFNLNGLIEGWQVGLPLIKKGGQIRLVVPSSMAYGCNGVPGTINSNSVLYFDINLIDVQ